MAAVAYPSPCTIVSIRPRLVAVIDTDTGLGAPGRPLPRTRPTAATYRRRRAVSLASLVLGTVALGLGVRAGLAGRGGGPSAITGPASAPAAHVHVVTAGDSLWSIVEGTGIRGDPRPEVDRLQSQLAGRPLQIGERLVLP